MQGAGRLRIGATLPGLPLETCCFAGRPTIRGTTPALQQAQADQDQKAGDERVTHAAQDHEREAKETTVRAMTMTVAEVGSSVKKARVRSDLAFPQPRTPVAAEVALRPIRRWSLGGHRRLRGGLDLRGLRRTAGYRPTVMAPWSIPVHARAGEAPTKRDDQRQGS